ncbi:MAG: hypothetical protein JJ855_15735 [Rhodospirillales bacterium]|nr:hypothetical protein [Rhodospirillales bacterium]
MSERTDPLSGGFELRDDNLRLLFSEAAKRDLNERLRAIELGFPLLAVAVLICVTGWVFKLITTTPMTDTPLIESLLRFDNGTDFAVSALLIGAAVLTAAAPVIYAMLVTERRRCRKEMADLAHLLQRYGRT